MSQNSNSTTFATLDSEEALSHHLQQIEDAKVAVEKRQEKKRLKRRKKTGKSKSDGELANRISQYAESLKSAKRPWIKVNSFSDLNSAFRIMTYNILAKQNTDFVDPAPALKFFGTSEPEYLHFKFRKKKILGEIGRYQPEIICLQEVDYPKEIAQPLRYKYDHHVAMDSDKSFGTMILFDKNRFEKIRFIDYDLSAFVEHQLDMKKEDIPESMRHKRTAVLVLKMKKTGHIFAVASSHIAFDFHYGDIKLHQAAGLTRYFAKLQASLGGIPIFLGADLNATPDSKIAEFIRQGKVEYGGMARRHVCGLTKTKENSLEQCPEGAQVSGGLPMKSAYRHSQNREPLYTTIKPKRPAKTVDYILTAASAKQPVKICNVLQSLSHPSLIPNDLHGSDHIPLCAAFQFTDPPAPSILQAVDEWLRKVEKSRKRKAEEQNRQKKKQRKIDHEKKKKFKK